jgi:HD-like signal output (HDOD) protein
VFRRIFSFLKFWGVQNDSLAGDSDTAKGVTESIEAESLGLHVFVDEPAAPNIGLLAQRGRWEDGAPADSNSPSDTRKSLTAKLYLLRDELTNEADRAFIERLLRVVSIETLEFPPFPEVARKLDRLLSRGDPSMFQVVRLVERDPSLVRRIWSAGSGAAYVNPPSSLHHAIARIGFDALWRIGMSICVHSPVFRVAGFQKEADEAREHGVLVADLAAWMSGEKRGEVYLSALLHDIGKLVVYRAASVREPTERPSRTLVDAVVNRFHSSIGQLATNAWNLGANVNTAVGFHHSPASEHANRESIIVWASDVAEITARLERRGIECSGLRSLDEHKELLPRSPGDIISKAREFVAAAEKDRESLDRASG